jgi:salicylate hydroxylase
MRSNSILIAGGGIGGLASALALARIGRTVTVLERSAAPTEAGAGIQLGPNAVKALRQLGVADIVEQLATAPTALTVRNGRDATVLATTPLSSTATRYGAPYWVIHRADLHRALFEAASAQANIQHQPGFDIASAARTRGGATITSTDGRSVNGAALIGADGVWSRVRASLMPGADPKPSGFIAYRALIPSENAGILAASEIGAWLAPDAHVVHYPVHAGRSINVVVIKRDAWLGTSWNEPASRDDVAAATQTFARALQDALAGAPHWHKWSLAAPLRLNTFVRGPVALLGDAAHPILPFLAQGGAMALEDAVQLAASVSANPTDLPLALITYDRARQRRVHRVASTASRNGQIFHLSGPIALARNLTLRTLSPNTLITRLNWLYGFEGPQLKNENL